MSNALVAINGQWARTAGGDRTSPYQSPSNKVGGPLLDQAARGGGGDQGDGGGGGDQDDWWK